MYIKSIIALTMLSINVTAQNTIPINLDVSISSTKVMLHKDLVVKFTFTTLNPNKKISFPSCLTYGYDFKADNWNKADIVFDVERIIKSHYSKKAIRANISDDTGGRICYDSTGAEMIDILSIKRPLFYTKNMALYYVLIKGKYRFRVRFNVPNITSVKGKFFYSKWLYFEVLK